ncbi:28052_t:CDS:1, partial [Gigaspora margarita]
IHPENLLSKEDYEAYITDIGLLKLLDEKEEERIHKDLPYTVL